MKNPTDFTAMRTLKNSMLQTLQNKYPDLVEDTKISFQQDDPDLKMVISILDTIFSVVIVVTMVLCLFSLTSSMSANLLD